MPAPQAPDDPLRGATERFGSTITGFQNGGKTAATPLDRERDRELTSPLGEQPPAPRSGPFPAGNPGHGLTARFRPERGYALSGGMSLKRRERPPWVSPKPWEESLRPSRTTGGVLERAITRQ